MIRERIKIVYFIGELAKGGSERQLFLLLKYINKNLFDPYVVVFNPSENAVYNEEIQKLGVKVISIPPKKKSILGRILFLRKQLKEINPKIIHSWTVHDNPYAGILSFILKIPINLGSMRDSLDNEGFISLPKIIQNICLNNNQYLFVNSISIHSELLKRKVPNKKIIILKNCVEIDEDPSLTNMDIFFGFRDNKIIGTVGNLKPKKNHEMFIDGLAKVINDYVDVIGIIVGSPIATYENYLESIELKIAKYDLKEKLIIAGFIDNAQAIMSEFFVFCLLSKYEGTPNVILEAMAAGRPVIATRVGGISDIIEDGVNGYIINPDDLERFVISLKILLNDPLLAESMGDSGRNFVIKNHSCEIITKELEKVYLQFLTKI